MVKAALLTSVALALAGAPCAVGSDTVDLRDVLALERTITLPRGAEPLARYARYYTIERDAGRRFLRGYYILGDYILGDARPGRYLHESPTIVADGGCAVVTVFLDLETRRPARAYCNGYA